MNHSMNVSKLEVSDCNVPTFSCIHCWYVQLVEKYGKMILKFSETCNELETLHRKKKVEQYIKDIEYFIMQCKKKVALIEDEDNKNDVLIIHDRMIKFHENVTIFLMALIKE
jgi:hypothetical protein